MNSKISYAAEQSEKILKVVQLNQSTLIIRINSWLLNTLEDSNVQREKR